MSISIRYRLATKLELQTIVDFQIEMARESEGLSLNRPTVEKGVARVFEEPRWGRYYLAVAGDRILASTLVQYEWSDWRNGVVWWIHSVYVISDFRRKGVFRGMYAHLKQEAALNSQVRGLRLYVEKHNHGAQRTYQDLGMSADRYDLYEEMFEERSLA